MFFCHFVLFGSFSSFGILANGADSVSVTVDLDKVVFKGYEGQGASWHCLEKPLPGTNGGSGWGANPPPDDEDAWNRVYTYASWLGMDFVRVELSQRVYENDGPGQFNFSSGNAELQILRKILDWCCESGAKVFLQQMWSNVEWNALDADDPLRSAPKDVDAFAEGIATLVGWLQSQGYDCIEHICLTNEPPMWWKGEQGQSESITPALKATRKALDEKTITIPLTAPDATDLPEIDPSQIDYDPYIGSYDLHSYWANFDWNIGTNTTGYSLAEAERRIRDWITWADSHGNKPFFLSELGTMIFGWQNSNPAPSCFNSSLKDSEFVIRGLGLGIRGFNHWSFINRGDLDGQWQMVETWDIAENKLLPWKEFSPHPNDYFVYGLFSRFTATDSEILSCSVLGGTDQSDYPRVFAATLRSPAGNISVLVVNDAWNSWAVNLTLNGSLGDLGSDDNIIYVYEVTQSEEDNPDLQVDPIRQFPITGNPAVIRDVLSPRSVTVYSTFHLTHDQAGIVRDVK